VFLWQSFAAPQHGHCPFYAAAEAQIDTDILI